MSFATVTEPPPTGLVTTTPSRIGVLPEKLTGVIGTVMVLQVSCVIGVAPSPVHLSAGLAEFVTTAVPKTSTPATAPVTTAPATKPVPVMVIGRRGAVKDRLRRSRTVGVRIDGAAPMREQVGERRGAAIGVRDRRDLEPPCRWRRRERVTVPKIAFGVTWVTVAVPAVPPLSLPASQSRPPRSRFPRWWNGTAVEPMRRSPGSRTVVTFVIVEVAQDRALDM